MVFLGWVFDAADGSIYALTLPLMREEFGLNLTHMGYLGSFFLFGSMMGAIFLPFVADRHGRRLGMMLSIGLYSAFTGFTSIVQNWWQLAIARFFTGIGTGAEWPIGAAFLSESVPAHKRGFALGIMQAGYPVGYFITAVIFFTIVSMNWSWRGCYILPVIPGLIVLFYCSKLRESDRWIAEREVREKQQAAGQEYKKVGYGELLKKGYRKFTAIATIMHFCGGFYAWAVVMWFPSILMIDFKIDKLTTSYITMAMWAVAGLGYTSAGPISDKIGRKATMAIYMTGSLVTSIIIHTLKSNVGAEAPQVYLWLLACSVGWFMGAWTVLITYSTEIFPTRVRSIGAGFAVGVGRVGAVITPTVMGTVAQHYTVSIGLVLAAIIGSMMIPAILCGPETAMKRLEDIVQ